jgi:hypothetical protein
VHLKERRQNKKEAVKLVTFPEKETKGGQGSLKVSI